MKIEISKSKKDKKWRFHAKARNGNILAVSKGYKNKENAYTGAVALLRGARIYCEIVETK